MPAFKTLRSLRMSIEELIDCCLPISSLLQCCPDLITTTTCLAFSLPLFIRNLATPDIANWSLTKLIKQSRAAYLTALCSVSKKMWAWCSEWHTIPISRWVSFSAFATHLTTCCTIKMAEENLAHYFFPFLHPGYCLCTSTKNKENTNWVGVSFSKCCCNGPGSQTLPSHCLSNQPSFFFTDDLCLDAGGSGHQISPSWFLPFSIFCNLRRSSTEGLS